MKEAVKEINRQRIARLAKKLEEHNFGVTAVETAQEAFEFLKREIPKHSTIGTGGSVTLDELGVIDWLTGNPDYQFLDRFHTDDRTKIFRESLLADVYLTSTNAVTMDGMLYNVDGTGNRLAALIYGPDKVYVIAGVNKIVPDLEAAKKRVENHTAPANCVRLKKDNPCVRTGECAHCSHAATICNQYVITRRSGEQGRIHVILVNEELGY